jgi:putative transposase
MPNHIHLIAVPEKHESLALALHDTHTAYAVWANRKQGASGHLWQGRFYSCVMDETHLTAAARYVERNPVRAGMVPRAEEYAWSSAAAHCGTRSDNLITPDCPLTGMIPDWSRWLADEDIQAVQEIRQRTRTGKPCVNPEFVALLESMTGRSLRPAKRGRKPLIRGQTPN